MKNILFSTTSFDTIDNGPALFANLLYDQTINQPLYDVRILSEDIKTNSLNKPKIYQLRLSQNIFNRFFYQFFRISKYHKETIRIQKEFNFDALIYNNAFTGVKSTGYFQKPVLVMVNDDNKLLFDKSRFQLSKTYFKYRTLFKLEKKASLLADTVIVNSIYMKKLVHDIYKVNEDRIKILIKGIDLSKYEFRLRQSLNKKVHVLFVKADYNRGGFFDLVDALTALKSENIKLTVIGPPENSLPILNRYAEESGLVNFDINGPLRPEKVRDFFKTADIFCVPSHKEALGVANMEALASGVPVISTKVGGIPEVLDDGKAGWLVEPETPSQLADAIKECIKNKELRIQKSKYGYQHVQQFNSEKLIDNFLKIVDEAIDENGKS